MIVHSSVAKLRTLFSEYVCHSYRPETSPEFLSLYHALIKVFACRAGGSPVLYPLLVLPDINLCCDMRRLVTQPEVLRGLESLGGGGGLRPR